MSAGAMGFEGGIAGGANHQLGAQAPAILEAAAARSGAAESGERDAGKHSRAAARTGDGGITHFSTPVWIWESMPRGGDVLLQELLHVDGHLLGGGFNRREDHGGGVDVIG